MCKHICYDLFAKKKSHNVQQKHNFNCPHAYVSTYLLAFSNNDTIKRMPLVAN